MALHSHLIATLFLVFISFCYGRHFAEHSSRVKRYFYRGPIKNALNSDNSSRSSVDYILSHFNDVGNEMRRLRNTSYGSTGLRELCNVVDTRIRPHRVAQRLRMFGFTHFKSRCITDMKIGNAFSLRKHVTVLQRTLKMRQSDVLSHRDVGWDNVYFPFEYNYTSFAQNCSLYHVPALRLNSSWVLLASMTRYEQTNNSKDKTRPYIEELVKGNETGLQNVLLNTGEQVNATSVESMWGGKGSASVFGGLPNNIEYGGNNLEDNPAIKAVLSSNSRWLEQIESSFNIANIATMTIPCLLAFIPLSFFQEPKLQAVFFYVLFTDVIACAPLAIKGIELIHFTNRFHGGVRTRVYGLDYELDLGVAEVWAVRCVAPKSVYSMGVKFVFFAFLAMVLGIGIEVFMLMRIKRRKRQEENNRPPDRWWVSHTACIICFCRHSIRHKGSRGVFAPTSLLFRIPSHDLPVLPATT